MSKDRHTEGTAADMAAPSAGHSHLSPSAAHIVHVGRQSPAPLPLPLHQAHTCLHCPDFPSPTARTANGGGGILGFLLPDAIDASAGIDVIVDSPIRAFATVCEWARDFLETRVKGEVVPDRVLAHKNNKKKGEIIKC